MHIKELVPMVRGLAVKAVGFIRRPACAMYADRRKRAAVALLVMAPLLLTGDVEIFALNLVGLGFGALLLRRFTRARDRRQAAQTRQTAETTTDTRRTR